MISNQKSPQVINAFIVEGNISPLVCHVISVSSFERVSTLQLNFLIRFFQLPSTYLIILYLHWAMTRDLVLCAAGAMKHVKFSNFQIDSPRFEVSSLECLRYFMKLLLLRKYTKTRRYPETKSLNDNGKLSENFFVIFFCVRSFLINKNENL